MCFLGDSRREIRNLVILNDEKHCFARERRSDKKHASPRCALRCKQSSALFLLRVVAKIISGYVMKLKNSLAILFISLRSILLMPAQF